MSQLKWPRNRLLLALPASNLKRLISQLELVPCERGRILLDADSILDDYSSLRCRLGRGALRGREHYRDGDLRQGGLHRVSSHLWRQRVFGPVSRATSGKCSEDVAQRVLTSHESDAGFPQSDARIRASRYWCRVHVTALIA